MSPPGRPGAVEQKPSHRAADADDGPTVKGRAMIKLFASGVVGFPDLPLHTTEWYRKDVGLLQVQRGAPANATCLAGGTVTLELTEWP